jgi:hypothetical protein
MYFISQLFHHLLEDYFYIGNKYTDNQYKEDKNDIAKLPHLHIRGNNLKINITT